MHGIHFMVLEAVFDAVEAAFNVLPCPEDLAAILPAVFMETSVFSDTVAYEAAMLIPQMPAPSCIKRRM